MRKPKFKFKRVYFLNRWRQPKYHRHSNWVIFGVYKWWCSWDSYCYMIGFFGLEMRLWFETREVKI